jgi:hypothetical protein
MIRSENAPKKELNHFNFKLIENYDIDKIKKHIESFESEWEINTFRQNRVYFGRPNPHLHTKTYTIQDHSLDWKFGSKIDSTLVDKQLYDICKDIIEDLEKKFNGKAGRVLLIKLLSKSEVYPHTDKGDYLSTVNRVHIPIITNSNVFYTVNNESINMKVGECWEINNFKTHSVSNKSDEDRVHLLIDILPLDSYI